MACVATSSETKITVGEIFIAAPPARVFEAISDPSQMHRWWGQSGLHRIIQWKADLRPGGRWSSAGISCDGMHLAIEGEYLEVDAPRLLVHTWIPSWMAAASTVVRWELQAHAVHSLHCGGPRKAGTGTLVRILQEGFVDGSVAGTGQSDGWNRVLGWLQAFLETGDTVEERVPA